MSLKSEFDIWQVTNIYNDYNCNVNLWTKIKFNNNY